MRKKRHKWHSINNQRVNLVQIGTNMTIIGII